MGILVEFNPDLALRNASEHKAGRRKIEECIPEPLEAGKTYEFLKRGQRNYWLRGEIPLLETSGYEDLSRPKASIVITEVTHTLENNDIWTRGQFRVVEVFSDDAIHFDGFERAGRRE
jgi:hypothetical protein